MDSWGLLGLEAGASKKVIKQAYAQRLKQTRPDEDPTGFKALHNAYQWALRHSEQETLSILADDDFAEKRDTPTPADSNTETIAIADLGTEVLTAPTVPLIPTPPLIPPQRVVITSLPPPPIAQPLVKEIKSINLTVDTAHTLDIKDLSPSQLILSTVEQTLNSSEERNNEWVVYQDDDLQYTQDWQLLEAKLAIIWNTTDTDTVIDNPSQWHFLAQLPSIGDLEFRQKASYKIFSQVAEANRLAIQNKTLVVKPAVLNYLNQLFNWETHWQDFERDFGKAQINAVFPYLDSVITAPVSKPTIIEPQELLLVRRVAAFLIDGVVVFLGAVVTIMIADLMLGNSKDVGVLVILIGMLVVNSLLEILPPWHATLGKRLLKIQVVNKQGKTISILQSLARTFLTLLSLAGIKFTAGINLFMIGRKNILLQDWLTRSYVIRR